ncbi:uncharacterized protein LOC129987734 [Argiope bruennichi]|uniref:uncharacterized protein LOC129987734 n=1 Tax=Argiope bruennichi TaxID=94029 RepID=UPI0024950EA1|nr:uncharacterized protein LOC129987734 [Argiope bruennichi]
MRNEEFQNVIFHILNIIQKKKELTVCTSLFKLSIYIYPWKLCTKICFKSSKNEFYSAAEHQFLLTFLDNNQKVTESSHIVENIHKERIHNSDNSSDILIVDSEITEIKERLPTNGDFENAAKKLKVCKMEEERLKKLSNIPILEIPKVQNPKEHTKKEKGILFRIFRYIFG